MSSGPTPPPPADLLNDGPYLTPAKARFEWPEIDGRYPGTCAVWRKMTRGECGILLPHLRVGRRFVTTPKAIHWWLRAVTEARIARSKADSDVPPITIQMPRSLSAREKAAADAARQLEEVGI